MFNNKMLSVLEGRGGGLNLFFYDCLTSLVQADCVKKGKRKVHKVPQSQAAALPRHQEKEETDKTKQAQIKQTQEKH